MMMVVAIRSRSHEVYDFDHEVVTFGDEKTCDHEIQRLILWLILNSNQKLQPRLVPKGERK